MSRNYYTFKRYYDRGLWDINRLRAVVGKPTGITAEEFQQITGVPYEGGED